MRRLKKHLFTVFIIILSTAIHMPDLSARGIIIADGDFIRPLFRDSSRQDISDFASELSGQYAKVVLHLGSRFAFQRGGLFFYRTSRQNLVTFSDTLQQARVSLELWILDSFGAESFMEIYGFHQSIIRDNLAGLSNLGIQFDSVIIDLEWINLPDANNGGKFLEILGLLKEQLPDKQVKAFVPLIDNERENLARGYDQEALEKLEVGLIPMLYLIDGGFYGEKGKLSAYLNDSRIEQLRSYYATRNYTPAVSMEGGLVLEKGSRFYFVKTITKPQSLSKAFKRTETEVFRYYKIDTLVAQEDTDLVRNDGKIESIEKGDRLHLIEIRNTILNNNDYVWHYGLVN